MQLHTMRFKIAIISIFLFLESCGQVNLTEKTILKEWSIDNYIITLSKKLGPVGPSYLEYDLYKGKK